MSESNPVPVVVEQDKSTDFIKDDFNLYGIFALGIALLSLAVAAITLYAQSKTEKHTQNAPISVQIGQFKDMTRHLYRNLVCTSAAIARYKNSDNKFSEESGPTGKYKAYPSESHFVKLKAMPDDVILDIDANKATYKELHELKVLLRNYNVEIDVASNHISNPVVWKEAIEQDFNNLLFKPLHLVKEAFEPESLMMSADSGKRPIPDRSVMIILEEHFKKLKENLDKLTEDTSIKYLQDFFRIPENASQSEMDEFSIFANAVKNNFSEIIDSKDGVKKSLKNLAEKAWDSFGSRITEKVKDEEGKDKYTISISKTDFLNYLDARERENLSKIVSKINHMIRKNRCELFKEKLKAAVCRSNRENTLKRVKMLEASLEKNKQRKKQLETPELKTFVDNLSSDPKLTNISVIEPYLSYINREEWKFEELLYLILAVDTSIEAGKIGMVNYE